MPLTQAEQAELDALERELAPAPVQTEQTSASRLTPEEEAELTQLEQELGEQDTGGAELPFGRRILPDIAEAGRGALQAIREFNPLEFEERQPIRGLEETGAREELNRALDLLTSFLPAGRILKFGEVAKQGIKQLGKPLARGVARPRPAERGGQAARGVKLGKVSRKERRQFERLEEALDEQAAATRPRGPDFEERVLNRVDTIDRTINRRDIRGFGLRRGIDFLGFQMGIPGLSALFGRRFPGFRQARRSRLRRKRGRRGAPLGPR